MLPHLTSFYRVVGALLVVLPLWVPPVPAEDMQAPEQATEQGQAAFQKGAFAAAIQHWYEAARQYEAQGHARQQALVLNYLGQALQQVGRYKEAGSVLSKSMTLAQSGNDQALEASSRGRLGALYLAMGQIEQADKSLNGALTIARALNQPGLTASLLNDLGNLKAFASRQSEAIEAYAESAELAKQNGNPSLAIVAQLNAAKAAAQTRQYETAKARLDAAAQEIQALPDSHDKAFAYLNLGAVYDGLLSGTIQLAQSDVPETTAAEGTRGAAALPSQQRERGVRLFPDIPPQEATMAPVSPPFPKEDMTRSAATAFWGALRVSQATEDVRAESYAWGSLGQLYEREGRSKEALDLTRRAVLAAQKVRAPESLYRWHWQTARLLKKEGERKEAILAYQRAIQSLQPIRPEMMVGYGRRQSFNQTIKPLYLELTDLLLQQTGTVNDQQQGQALLVQAQDTLESFKAAELQDYFRDECVGQAQKRSTELVQGVKTTAILYPVILPDRLELLVGYASGLKQYTIPVGADQLTREVRAFRRGLETRTNNAYLDQATKLYNWIIRPLETDLTAAGINTLVFVPDGALRTIPMAALHDGSQFLIAKYAVAVTPGLQLTDPQPIDRSKVRFLSAGLSDSVQGFPALPNVAKELTAINKLYGGPLLLNERFKAPQMASSLKEEPVNVVHLASHGLVESDVNKSFILTFDDKITMDQLGQLVGLFQYRGSPLELLTLSACETAAGDDRAALGLAGVAVKAGARSALATLWFIDDQATADLVESFYLELRDASISKAAALQRAQVKMLQEPGRQHPSYWAPFLLINNWL